MCCATHHEMIEVWASDPFAPPKRFVPADELRREFQIFHTEKSLRLIYGQPYLYMGVSKNSGTPKWMVYTGKPYKNG